MRHEKQWPLTPELAGCLSEIYLFIWVKFRKDYSLFTYDKLSKKDSQKQNRLPRFLKLTF